MTAPATFTYTDDTPSIRLIDWLTSCGYRTAVCTHAAFTRGPDTQTLMIFRGDTVRWDGEHVTVTRPDAPSIVPDLFPNAHTEPPC